MKPEDYRARFHGRPYRPTISRAIWSFRNSDFCTRDLDADEVAFIEKIRECGRLAVGSLAYPAPSYCNFSDSIPNRDVIVEELEFWEDPYAQDKDNPPRSPLPHTIRPATPSAAWLAKRKRDLLARAEMNRLLLIEQAEWERQNFQREERRRRADLEWELATKEAKRKRRKFGDVRKRRYIPQWQIDQEQAMRAEARAQSEAIDKQARAKAAKELKQEAEQRAQEAREAVQREARRQATAKVDDMWQHFANRLKRVNPRCCNCRPYNGHHTPNYWGTEQEDCW